MMQCAFYNTLHSRCTRKRSNRIWSFFTEVPHRQGVRRNIYISYLLGVEGIGILIIGICS